MWFDLTLQNGPDAVWMDRAFPGGYSSSAPWPTYAWDTLGVANLQTPNTVYVQASEIINPIVIGHASTLDDFAHYENGSKDVLPSWKQNQKWNGIWDSIEEHSRLYVEGYI